MASSRLERTSWEIDALSGLASIHQSTEKKGRSERRGVAPSERDPFGWSRRGVVGLSAGNLAVGLTLALFLQTLELFHGLKKFAVDRTLESRDEIDTVKMNSSSARIDTLIREKNGQAYELRSEFLSEKLFQIAHRLVVLEDPGI
jgi:hypothetical protein